MGQERRSSKGRKGLAYGEGTKGGANRSRRTSRPAQKGQRERNQGLYMVPDLPRIPGDERTFLEGLPSQDAGPLAAGSGAQKDGAPASPTSYNLGRFSRTSPSYGQAATRRQTGRGKARAAVPQAPVQADLIGPTLVIEGGLSARRRQQAKAPTSTQATTSTPTPIPTQTPTQAPPQAPTQAPTQARPSAGAAKTADRAGAAEAASGGRVSPYATPAKKGASAGQGARAVKPTRRKAPKEKDEVRAAPSRSHARERQASFSRGQLWLALGTAALMLVITGVALYPPAQGLYTALANKQVSQEKLASVQASNAELQDRAAALLTAAGIQDEARTKYGYVMPGETLVRVTGNPGTQYDATASSAAGGDWTSSLLDAFFGRQTATASVESSLAEAIAKASPNALAALTSESDAAGTAADDATTDQVAPSETEPDATVEPEPEPEAAPEPDAVVEPEPDGFAEPESEPEAAPEADIPVESEVIVELEVAPEFVDGAFVF